MSIPILVKKLSSASNVISQFSPLAFYQSLEWVKTGSLIYVWTVESLVDLYEAAIFLELPFLSLEITRFVF